MWRLLNIIWPDTVWIMLNNSQQKLLSVILLTLIMTTSCVSTNKEAISPSETDGYVNPSDYAVTGSVEKSIDLEGVQTVQIYCYCESEFTRTESFDDKLTLKVIGTERSVGYHGPQETPNEVSDAMLNFKETRIGSTLKLESHEYFFIHHSYLIDHLEISAPARIEIRLNQLEYNKLQGRNIN